MPKNLLRLIFVILVFSVSAFTQPAMRGRVAEVLDSRTVVIESSHNARFTIQLRAIETPDENQPLFETVKSHLSNLLLGKEVSFQISSLGIGTIYVNGADSSAQMLRDGAAWYVFEGQNLPPEADAAVYRSNESLARDEKRGVWGIPGLRPTSEMKKMAANSKDPFSDPTIAQVAWRSLGPAVESVFGYEHFSIERNDCAGRVVSVVDGDTVKVLNSQNREITIRLAGIDAPEKSQASGMTAKQYLTDLVLGKTVGCESSKTDRYGRVVGKLSLNGTDVNLQMVRGCQAWHYKEYSKEQNSNDQALYSEAEIISRNNRCGLWADGTAIRPSDFRRDRFYAFYVRPHDPNDSIATRGYSPGSSIGGPSKGGPVPVKSYTRRNGTVVRSHTRSRPN
ncbi:MAG TPA: thermonuclease family protein [Pyrinomonadaceae bacterium]|nr:thermonuclease family protein [Pyrinomonadaceae bacterium]